MSLLPDSASFEEQVCDYFLAVRGAGLMLSALDAELLLEWSRAGVPFEVVARGIARCAEKARWDARPGEPVLRSLRACKRTVDAEIKRHLERSVGAGVRNEVLPDHPAAEALAEQGLRAEEAREEAEVRETAALAAARKRRRAPPPWEHARHAKLCAVLSGLARREPALAGRVVQLLSGPLAQPPAGPQEMDVHEARAGLGLLRALPFAERGGLWRGARVAGAHDVALSPRVRRTARRFRVLMAVWARLGLERI